MSARKDDLNGNQRRRAEKVPKASKQKSKARAQKPLKPINRTKRESPLQIEIQLARVSLENIDEEELKQRLISDLKHEKWKSAVILLLSSPSLSSQYKITDIIRLMIERKAFNEAVQFIRELELHHENPLLIAFFIKELVQDQRFSSAITLAQDTIADFSNTSENSQNQISWTPRTLIQAMIRGKHFRLALKYSKQYNLLSTFPLSELLAFMMEHKQWEDTVSVIFEWRLFDLQQMETVITGLVEQRLWSIAMRCVNRIMLDYPDKAKELRDRVIREACDVQDFVAVQTILREQKMIDSSAEHKDLLQYFVHALIQNQELYKAIKYSIKFDLQQEYAVDTLIHLAIESEQYHIAIFYIYKLKKQNAYREELEEMDKAKRVMLMDFRNVLSIKKARLAQKCKELALPFEEEEIVLSIEQEIIPAQETQSNRLNLAIQYSQNSLVHPVYPPLPPPIPAAPYDVSSLAVQFIPPPLPPQPHNPYPFQTPIPPQTSKFQPSVTYTHCKIHSSQDTHAIY